MSSSIDNLEVNKLISQYTYSAFSFKTFIFYVYPAMMTVTERITVKYACCKIYSAKTVSQQLFLPFNVIKEKIRMKVQITSNRKEN